MFLDWSSCTSDGTAGGTPTLSCIFLALNNFIAALIIFAGITALTMFILGGYKFINSGGDPKKIDSAKKNFTYGILGLSIILLSFLIIFIISKITGLECLTEFSFTCSG